MEPSIKSQANLFIAPQGGNKEVHIQKVSKFIVKYFKNINIEFISITRLNFKPVICIDYMGAQRDWQLQISEGCV